MKNLQEAKKKFVEQQLWGFNDEHKELIEEMMDRTVNIIEEDNSNSEKINEMWNTILILSEQLNN